MLNDLIIFQKVYDFLLWLKPTVQRFTKAHKYSLGADLEKKTLELLEQIVRANLSRDKRPFIEECFVRYEIIQVFIRLAREYNLLSAKQYEYASKQLAEIGRLLGGWLKKFSNSAISFNGIGG